MHRDADAWISLAYLRAKKEVLASRYATEAIEPSATIDGLCEPEFLRELAWVILSAGMAEAVVRRVFPAISECFLNWRSADAIADQSEDCKSEAITHFQHEGKIDAIAEGCKRVSRESFETIRREIIADPISALASFPYVGPTTVFHLAKNIGIQVAKPDRHLIRLANASGFSDVQDFCGRISDFLGEDIRKVDSVLWRFATLNRNYIDKFRNYAA